MGLPPWELSDGQVFALITGVNSGLGFAIACRLIEDFLGSPTTSPKKHLVLILITRSPMKTRFTISRLRAHLRKVAEYSPYATKQQQKANSQGAEYSWADTVRRVHFLGVEADLCDLRSVYAVADKLVNGTVGSPDATTINGNKLPHGSPGTNTYSEGLQQDQWALSQEPGSEGAQRAWGWGLSGIRVPRLDVILLPAGTGGWTGVNILHGIRDMILDPVEAVTRPKYKLAKLGVVVKAPKGPASSTTSDEITQPLLSDQEDLNDPPLGEVFCSNVFGHYVLAHELMPLLSRKASPETKFGGKIVWVSSTDSTSDHFSIDDIQGLKSSAPYETSKRLMDFLALTAVLPSVQRISASYFDFPKTVNAEKEGIQDSGESEDTTVQPRMYLCQPGIFVSSLFPANWLITALMTMVFYYARWIGSPWHGITAEKASVAPVWLALTDDDTLEETEGNGLRKCKWGSATNARGEERVMKTEVDGWGWNGQVEAPSETDLLRGRRRGAIDVSREEREEFEVIGGKCWAQMEDLRREWEGILGVKK